MTTPTRNPPRSSGLNPADLQASEQELVAQLQQALAPSFVLVRRLGAGGMGVVYLARDPALKRLVAVKVMLPERAADPEARARFEREAEAVAAISHPNVVAVYSVGELANGLPYLVMQYVDGAPMSQRLKTEGPLDLESAKTIIGQVASALGAAHRKGIIHRDIKAANILWDDAAGRALVSDFGIAAVLAAEYDTESIRLTQTGMVMGTPQYMSPEQLLSEPVTEKTDIYSLGVLGYELLTGEGPYQVTSPNEIVAAHLRDMPKPLSMMRADVEPELESLLASCLSKDAHGRPAAEEVARRLERGASVLLEWPPPGLEDMRGAAVKPIMRLMLGSFALTAPLILMTMSERGSVLRFGWPHAMIIPTIGSIGALTVVFAAVETLRIARMVRTAAKAGYPWSTITEVLVDGQGSTGALITGEREFAAISPEDRARFRRGRVLAAGLKMLGGAWTTAGFFLALPIAARTGSAFLLALFALGIPGVMFLGAGELEARETRAVKKVRQRFRAQRSPMERLSALATTWKESFERIVDVGRVSPAPSRILRRVAAGVALGAVVAAGTLGSFAMMVFGLAGEAANAISSPLEGRELDRARQLERLRALRPAVDPSITPLRAGQALHALTTGMRETASMPPAFPLSEPVRPNALNDNELYAAFGRGVISQGFMRMAKAGLTPPQRKYLMEHSGGPGEAEFRLLARAARADHIAAALPPAMVDSITIMTLPIPRLNVVRSVANLNIVRAALDVADGRIASAEQRLRDNIGVGFVLMDNPTLIENMYGRLLITEARKNLVALYDVTGRPAQGREFSESNDPAVDQLARLTVRSSMRAAEREEYNMRLILDSTVLRGLRWETAFSAVATQPCTDVRQIIFGADSVHLARVAATRAALVRTQGEEYLMRLIEQALQRPVPVSEIELDLANRSMFAFARTVDRLTGSRRMESCLLGGLQWEIIKPR